MPFEFRVGTSDAQVDRWLDAYFDEPWGHELDLLPLMAARRQRWRPADLDPSSPVIRHLGWSLRRWSAFRNGSVGVSVAQSRLATHVGRFVEDIGTIFPGRLSEVPDDQLPSFARRLTERCLRFGKRVKGTASCVLPSKTAHLLLPELVPAYDNAEIKNEVLAKLIPGRRRGEPFEIYVKLAWSVIQELRERVALNRFRGTGGYSALFGTASCIILSPLTGLIMSKVF